jgi:hypothetical protein
VGTNGGLYLLPTKKRGFTEIGDLNVQGLVTCKEDSDSQNSVTLEAELNSRSLDLNPYFPISLQQLNFGTQVEEERGVRIGLFWDPWVHRTHKLWGYHLIQSDFRSLTSRVSLLPSQEMGIQALTSQGFSQFGIRISNGELWPNLEEGANKDITVWWEGGLLPDSQFSLFLYGRVGRFDFVNQESNQKGRIGFLVSYQNKNQGDHSQARGFRSELQVILHESGVDGLIYQQTSPRKSPLFGEGMDLAPLGGQKIQGYVVDLWMGYEFEESKSDLFFKLSEAQLDNRSNQYKIVSNQLGFSYPLSVKAKMSFFTTQTEYQEGFGLGTGDRLSMGLNFAILGY